MSSDTDQPPRLGEGCGGGVSAGKDRVRMLLYLLRYFFFLFKTKIRKTPSLVHHLTLDDEFPVLIMRVFHGVEGLLGDAVEVHVPPVFQHLECDVCTVDHCPRCL